MYDVVGASISFNSQQYRRPQFTIANILVLHNKEKFILITRKILMIMKMFQANEYTAYFRLTLIGAFNALQFHHNSLNGAFTS